MEDVILFLRDYSGKEYKSIYRLSLETSYTSNIERKHTYEDKTNIQKFMMYPSEDLKKTHILTIQDPYTKEIHTVSIEDNTEVIIIDNMFRYTTLVYRETDNKEYIQEILSNNDKQIRGALKRVDMEFFEDYRYIKFNRLDDYMTVNIECKDIIDSINKKLPDNYTVDINYYYNLSNTLDNKKVYIPYVGEIPENDDLFLCLFLEDICVSTILIEKGLDLDDKYYTETDKHRETDKLEYKLEYNVAYIHSKTLKKYENRGYNKLLRACLMLIIQCVDKNITKIVSDVINMKSYHIIKKYYTVDNDIDNHNSDKKDYNTTLRIPINKHNIEVAEREIEKFVERSVE